MSVDLIKQQAYIDGEWVGTPSTFDVVNPATLEKIAHISNCGADEANAAVEAAARAFPLWKNKLASERAALLHKWKQLIIDNKEALARLLTEEQGKPFKESLAEISNAEAVEWSAEEAKRSYGETIPAFKSDTQVLTFREAIGVVAAITPWNFPHSMITRKVAPALAAGCTVVLKPAQDTPLSALALAALAEKAGFPKGVLNIVTASKENTEIVGKILTTHEKVRKVSFTGSTQVGRTLMKQASDTVKKVSLELGGNAPFIVFDSADIDAAVDGALANKFRNAGQTCICANRIFVQSGIHDQFVEAFAQKIKTLQLGNGLEENVTIGPLINRSGLDKVEKLVRNAEAKGALIHVGGKAKDDSLFYEPTLLTGMRTDMQAFEDEIFGPVAPIYKFESEEEAIELANTTIYGLAAYFYSNDIGQCFRVSGALEYGMIGINEIALSAANIPFGGIKQSGLGREGGPDSLSEFMETKYMLLNSSKKATA
ncbi:MAG: succinate-semialdehyde dehydrogenase (NADP(+)) [Micavibrio aeruginosavorus]|uniref:Succinate-semialdehyde dehydrogenase (NADP(+)) n=1 Tax=Micavibrio aeruginosavorus TaxID=349221 RepID=A0A2W5FEH1_9BACT|nr:MAG: succinate-semialdehyde dehydrogenase (NADP(+)) [Micavibrio aeruginosavorus]